MGLQGSPQLCFLISAQGSPSNRPHNLLTYFTHFPSNLPRKFHKSGIRWALFPGVDAVYAESPSSLGHSSQMHWDPRTSSSRSPGALPVSASASRLVGRNRRGVNNPRSSPQPNRCEQMGKYSSFLGSLADRLRCVLHRLQLDLSPGFPCSSVGKESAYNAGGLGSILGLGRSPGEGNGHPLRYPCLENPMDRGAWQTTVYGVARVEHDLVTKPPPLRAVTCSGTPPVPVPLPSLSHFLSPLSAFPEITSQINLLHLNPCLRVCFWEAQSNILNSTDFS